MNRLELHWLAGLLEGEGSFLKGPPSRPNMPSIAIEITDKDVIARVAGLLGVKYHATNTHKRGGGRWKPCYTTRVRGKSAVKVMKELYSLMGERRKRQIDEALGCYRRHPRFKLDEDKVREIRRLLKEGARTQADIAREFGVDRTTVGHIKIGRRWSHVTIK